MRMSASVDGDQVEDDGEALLNASKVKGGSVAI